MLQVVYVALCVLITVFCWISDEHSAQCSAALQGIDSKTLVLLGKVVLWLLVFIYYRFVQHHHSAVRRRGYLEFYRVTRELKSLPLLIHSAGKITFHFIWILSQKSYLYISVFSSFKCEEEPQCFNSFIVFILYTYIMLSTSRINCIQCVLNDH